LGKHAGDRLPHPEDPHKFLRCVTADTAWVESCPDKLFYNPHSQVCDWDTLLKATTTTVATTTEHDHAVLVKFMPRTDMVDGVVARSGLETTIIKEGDLTVTQRPDTILTLSPQVKPVLAASVPLMPVQSTSVSVQQEISPSIVSAVTPALEVIRSTPRAEFNIPQVIESTTLPSIVVDTTTVRIGGFEVVHTGVTPRSEFEIISNVARPVVPVSVESVVPVTPVAVFNNVAPASVVQDVRPVQQIVTPSAPIVNTIVPVQPAIVPVASVTSTSTIASIVSQSVDEQAIIEKQILQQRVSQLQEELLRIEQQVQQKVTVPVVVVSTTTPVARFNMNF
jgi:hypothetical protein